MKTHRMVLALCCILLLSGCLLPSTYYDPVDTYSYGLRWYDRGDYDSAARYWEPLAEKGDCDAQYWVGMLYFKGRGKAQDDDEAINLWLKAAEGNHPKAQAALGDLYYQKDAVVSHHCKTCPLEKDLPQAYFYYKLLEKSARYPGEKEYAARVIKSIRREMTTDQIVETEARVEAWTPTNLVCKPRHWW